MPRYYAIKRSPYGNDVEVGFFDAKDDEELERISEDLDDNPYIGGVIVMSEEEWNDLKNKIEDPEDWND